MEFKKTVHKTLRRGRFLRYRAYRKMGVAKHRKEIDLSLFLMFMFCAAIFPFFITPPEQAPEETCPEPEIIQNETVHEDLGDDPVVSAKQASLDELEKRAQLGELELSVITLEKGDSLFELLTREKVSAENRVAIVEALELMMDLKALRPGMSFMFFKDKENALKGLSIQPKP